MSVDGIGRGGRLPPGGGIDTGPGPTEGARPGSPFQVERQEGADPAAAVDRAAGVDALGRLQRGVIGVDQYLDERVADAVRHLEGLLPADEVDFVRQTLRDQLGSDPVLVELVRRATGTAASGERA